MHPAITFRNFLPARQAREGTRTSLTASVGPCAYGVGLMSPGPVRRAILMSAILVIATAEILTIAVLGATAPATTSEAPHTLLEKTEHLEQAAGPVFANLQPGLAQLRHSRPSVYSSRRAKLDDMSVAYSAYISGDYVTALRIIEPLAEKGDLRAQYILGYMHENGHVANQDFVLAAKWYRKAAAQGDAISEISLGLLYENGKGVAKDYAEAAKLYRSAADRGSARAHYRLGTMYRFGQGVPLDLVMAHVHFNIAATGFTVLPAQVDLERVAGEMTAVQLGLARQIAREWLTLHPPKSDRDPTRNILE